LASVSKSPAKKQPRLSITLKRKPTFRPYVEEDIKYFWASEKQKGNATDPKNYAEQIKNTLFAYYDVGFTMEAITQKGKMPVGAVFGKYMGPFLLLADARWLNWATDRNKLESIVNLLNELRKDTLVLFYSTMDDKDFYVHIARHGIAKRIGTIDDLFENGQAALFQTRTR